MLARPLSSSSSRARPAPSLRLEPEPEPEPEPEIRHTTSAAGPAEPAQGGAEAAGPEPVRKPLISRPAPAPPARPRKGHRSKKLPTVPWEPRLGRRPQRHPRCLREPAEVNGLPPRLKKPPTVAHPPSFEGRPPSSRTVRRLAGKQPGQSEDKHARLVVRLNTATSWAAETGDAPYFIATLPATERPVTDRPRSSSGVDPNPEAAGPSATQRAQTAAASEREAAPTSDEGGRSASARNSQGELEGSNIFAVPRLSSPVGVPPSLWEQFDQSAEDVSQVRILPTTFC